MAHLRKAGFKFGDPIEIKDNKRVVKFTRPDGSEILCIFGTVDSLMYNLCENKMNGTNFFINLVQTIHQHGPTKLKGPKGGFRYANQTPQMNKKTLLITDEATMLPESYAHAFATLMTMCHVDVHLAGDVQQSTYYEENLLTLAVREYRGTTDKRNLPSFRGCDVCLVEGTEVRRFNQKLVDFRNTVMRDFHENPSHALNIKKPTAALDMVHLREDYSIHKIEKVRSWDGKDGEEVQRSMTTIREELRKDVFKAKLLPNDILFVTPFVKNNTLMRELETYIHEFWSRTVDSEEYGRRLTEKSADETDAAVETRVARYTELKEYLEKTETLPWLCKLHCSEDGKSVDTRESQYGTRMVSIHAAQGDGRKFAYVVGLTEYNLKCFSKGKINLKYESLLNVAISRMKEVIRVFLEPKYDDIWKRFEPFLTTDMRNSAPPELRIKSDITFNADRASDELGEELFNQTKEKFKEVGALASGKSDDRPLVDYAHHVTRMAIAHTIFWAKLVVQQHQNEAHNEQVLTIFRKIARAEIVSRRSSVYYVELRKEKDIPVLHYDSGSDVWEKVHSRVLETLKEVQEHVKKWVRGEPSDMRKITPEHAVLLQYAVEVFKLAKNYQEEIKMDHVYDVVHAYIRKNEESKSALELHYDYLNRLTSMFEQVIAQDKGSGWQWKIYRSIYLGKPSGKPTTYFKVRTGFQHLFLPEQLAVPVIICPSVDEISSVKLCARALFYTVVMIQPEKTPTNEYKPTRECIQGRQFKVCVVPIKDDRPFWIDLTALVVDNFAAITEWILKYLEIELKQPWPEVLNLANYYAENFDKAVEVVSDTYNSKPKNCPAYILEAFNEATRAADIPELLERKLQAHLKVFRREIKPVTRF